MEISGASWLLLAAACFGAGFVDSIAGGGGLIAVPAFLFTGIPPAVALGTNKLVALTGSLTSTWRFAKGGLVRKSTLGLAAAAGLSSVAGAQTLMFVPVDLLRGLMIGLLVAALALVLWRQVHPLSGPPPLVTDGAWSPLMWAGTAALGFYDGFFGPGTGTLLVALFATAGRLDLRHASGNAKLVNFASNAGALALFAARGKLLPFLALTLIPFMVAGSWCGASLAIKRGAPFIRALFAAVVLALCAKLAWDLWR